MAMICDACATKYATDGGGGHLNVSPPRTDFKIYQAYAEAGRSCVPREPLALDLCLACTAKMLAHLGLSTEVCEPPQMPTAEVTVLDGALTEKDLKDLGL